MLAVARDDAGPLLGRDAETETLSSLLDRIERGGGALVLRGEPGIGKSRLLTEATALARERNIAVLRTTGVQCEASVAFSGCTSSCARCVTARPACSPLTAPCSTPRLGSETTTTPEQVRIAMAVLDLLCEVAAMRRPGDRRGRPLARSPISGRTRVRGASPGV